MGWFEDLFGIQDSDTTKMAEKEIAIDMLKDSKFMLNSMSMAITETTNPQLREILKRQLNSSIQNHFRLVDLSVQNNWYLPRSTPIEQVKQDYEEASTT
ncbi:spore coat protein [Desulfosporosinus meridiei]|uniref:Coat F domain-containing protein n=1 Tax=Desulfosporosinus meridiei (strain ATCC BAA-275 / DSM 13257 / KCTC 12902 / NCIMB 13706 / S10) TaxID=768704 RepID=J7IQP7_DESMD|nr:spore coat protein [Desulfosporosinus meridiei]AFQ44182.1 coat F domain-containing protein [Desulfosporosinus meridiei DSM 13257]